MAVAAVVAFLSNLHSLQLGLQFAVPLDMQQGYIPALVVRQYYLEVELAHSIAFQQEVEAVRFEIPARETLLPVRVHAIVSQSRLRGNMEQMRPHQAQMKRHSQLLRSALEELFRHEDDLVHAHFQREEQFQFD